MSNTEILVGPWDGSNLVDIENENIPQLSPRESLINSLYKLLENRYFNLNYESKGMFASDAVFISDDLEFRVSLAKPPILSMIGEEIPLSENEFVKFLDIINKIEKTKEESAIENMNSHLEEWMKNNA